MKKLKKLIIAVMVLAAMFALTACMEVNENIKINSDGSATIVSVVNIDKEKYIQYFDDMVFQQSGKHTTQAEKDEAEKEMLADGEYKLVTIDGKEYYQTKQSKKYTNKALNKDMNENSNSVSYVKNNVFYYNEKYTDDEIDAMMTDSDVSEAEMKDIIKVTYKVEFPKEIKAISGGKISSTNKKVAIFEVPYGKQVTMFASTSGSMSVKSVRNKIKELNKVSKTKITGKKAKKKTIELKLKKVKGATSYQVVYSTRKNFKNAKSKNVTSTKAALKNLKPGTKYYVKVRTAKKNYADQIKYSSWTSTVCIKTKK